MHLTSDKIDNWCPVWASCVLDVLMTNGL